ncbi:putative IBR domain-containing protein [Colletotrichum sublineola]|uniref:RBR-type E3 ubiquitin transferase n=1 Tax=Colletotrichum sublineola TaxID=1173701 RepID=A0A066XDY8_COLSU|nr:putative IBR domain-containing protein [Colletotrichum sublineola]
MVKVICHSYCRDCFERLIATAVQNEQQWPPKCCLNEIPFRTILRYVNKDLGKTYKDRSSEWKIPVSERIHCNQPDCGLWIRPDHVNPGLGIARCANAHWTCTICRGPQHDNSDCPQDRDLALTNALAEEEGWQHCSQCRALVEHLAACQHMTCRCGYQFCYVCNQRWRTCACTMDQLNAVKTGAARRREERLRREEEAESELRDALRQIEEFEREEALKAELLRQETERQEEERRKCELEERVRFESLRRHEIEVKYRDLREMLDQVHDLQEVLVRYQHDKERELVSHEALTSTAELEARQQAERLELAETASRKLAAKEKALTNEYSLRVLEEKKTEDAYLGLLEDFFANNPTSEARVEELMQDFLKKMDKGWRTWGKWRNEKTALYKMKTEEERTIREEVMHSVKIRHEERVESERRELGRRQVAELRWLTLVVAERARLLVQMETAEIEDGIDSIGLRLSEAKTSSFSSSDPALIAKNHVYDESKNTFRMADEGRIVSSHVRQIDRQKAEDFRFILDVCCWFHIALIFTVLQIIFFVAFAVMAPAEGHALEDWLSFVRGLRTTAVLFYELLFMFRKTQWISICPRHRLPSHATEFGSTISLLQQLILIGTIEPEMIQLWHAHQLE